MGEQVEHCNFPGDNKMEGALAADLDRVRDEVTPAQKMWVLDAAMKGQVDQLKMIKKRGIPLSIRGDYGESALHVAAGKGLQECLEFLIGEGGLGNGSLVWPDANRKTPLHYAARNNHLATVKWICATAPPGAGRLQDMRTTRAAHPLMFAAR